MDKNNSSSFSHILEFSAFPVYGKQSIYYCIINVKDIEADRFWPFRE